jgi:hypothetical protein
LSMYPSWYPAARPGGGRDNGTVIVSVKIDCPRYMLYRTPSGSVKVHSGPLGPEILLDYQWLR